MMFTIVVLLPFFCPVAKYPIPAPVSHPYLRRAVPTFNGACAEERASPARKSDSSSSTTCKMAAIASAGVVAGIAAAVVGCCSCCCADSAPRPAAAQQQHSSGTYGIAEENNLQYTPKLLEEQDANCMRIIALNPENRQ